MATVRRAAKIDATQAEIVKTLKSHGCEVISLAGVGNGVPDLLVMECDAPGWGRLVLVECKTGTGKLRPSQQRIIDAGWPVVVLRSAAEADAWIRGER